MIALLSSPIAFLPAAASAPKDANPSAPKVLASGSGCIQDFQAVIAVQAWFKTVSANYMGQLPEYDPRRNILEKINQYLQHAKEGLTLTPEEIALCNSSDDPTFNELVNGIKRVVPALYQMLEDRRVPCYNGM